MSLSPAMQSNLVDLIRHWGLGSSQAILPLPRKNVPEAFVFKPNVVIFEARIIAIPSTPLSKMKCIPVRQNVPTLRSYVGPSLDPRGNSSLSPCAPFYLPCFAIKNADIAPMIAPFLTASPAITIGWLGPTPSPRFSTSRFAAQNYPTSRADFDFAVSLYGYGHGERQNPNREVYGRRYRDGGSIAV